MTTLDTWTIGASRRGGTVLLPWHGDIAEIMVYNRALAVPERRQVERYLSQKYGIVVV